MKQLYLLLIGIFPLFFSQYLCGDLERPKDIVEHIRNFAHVFTPVTTFGFGQNILPQKSVIIFPSAYAAAGKKSNQFLGIPELIYGITDNLSLTLVLPIIITQKNDALRSFGTGNLLIQFEYAFFEKIEPTYNDQATIVFNIAPPTAYLHSTHDLLSTTTAFAATTSFFGGFTASHLSLDWYLYISAGAIINTGRHHSHLGNTILYEWGIGHYLGNFANVTCAAVLEFNGIYNQKSKYCRTSLANSGSNTLFIGPALNFCSDRWLLLAGIQFPAFQRFNGNQLKQYMQAIVAYAFRF